MEKQDLTSSINAQDIYIRMPFFFLVNQKSEMGQHLYNLNGKKKSFKNPIALWNYNKLKAAQFILIETIPTSFTKVKFIYIYTKKWEKEQLSAWNTPNFL